jgi:hypothetical protein
MYYWSDVPPSAALTGRHSTLSLHIPPFYQTSLREVSQLKVQQTKQTPHRSHHTGDLSHPPIKHKSLPSHRSFSIDQTKQDIEPPTLEPRIIARSLAHFLLARHAGRFVPSRLAGRSHTSRLAGRSHTSRLAGRSHTSRHAGRFFNHRFAVRSPPGSLCDVPVAALDGCARDRINVLHFGTWFVNDLDLIHVWHQRHPDLVQPHQQKKIPCQRRPA